MRNPLPRERYATGAGEEDQEGVSGPSSRGGQAPGQERDPVPRTASDPVDRLIRQGRQAFDRGNLHQAIQRFEEAASHDPSNLIIQSNLGSLYFRTRDYEKAREHYRMATEIDSNDAFTHLYLGLTHYRLGNTSLARRYLRRTLQIEPDNERAQQWLDRIEDES